MNIKYLFLLSVLIFIFIISMVGLLLVSVKHEMDLVQNNVTRRYQNILRDENEL